MRFSTAAVLALPALTVAEQQIPLLEKVKGFFNQATASVASVIPSAPSVPSAPVQAAAAKAAAAVQYNITLENWKETLTVDPTVSAPATQDWLIFITGGNATCYGFCGPSETAWNVSIRNQDKIDAPLTTVGLRSHYCCAALGAQAWLHRLRAGEYPLQLVVPRRTLAGQVPHPQAPG